ncbi:MAG: hypothetical protein IT350_16690 [Deltaproteobacteria bacterium]|nr:hypothetical protein [Deltaproteobacteria bacterium]
MKLFGPCPRGLLVAAACGFALAAITALRASPAFAPTSRLVSMCAQMGGEDRDACLIHAYRRSGDADLRETRTLWPLAVGALLRQGRPDDALRIAGERLGTSPEPATIAAYAATWVDDAMRADREDAARAVAAWVRDRGLNAQALARLDESVAWIAHRLALARALDRREYAVRYHEDADAPLREVIDLLRRPPAVSEDVLRDLTIRFRDVDDRVFTDLLELTRERPGFLGEAGAELASFVARRMERKAALDLRQTVDAIGNDATRTDEVRDFRARARLEKVPDNDGVTAGGNGSPVVIDEADSNAIGIVP